MLRIAPTARVSALADIEDSTRGSLIEIGEHVVIDSFVKLKPAGGTGDVVIGAGSVVNAGCVLYTGNGIRIGRNVLIAANCTLAPTNHAFDDPERPIRSQGFQPSRGGIVIGDDVWIGANTVLVDGVVIGSGSVIGAGSLVTGTLPAGCIAHGAPARVRGWRKPPVAGSPPGVSVTKAASTTAIQAASPCDSTPHTTGPTEGVSGTQASQAISAFASALPQGTLRDGALSGSPDLACPPPVTS